MEVGNVDCDEGVEYSMSIGLGFNFTGAPASPPPVKLDLLPQAPLDHASASLVSLPGVLNPGNERPEMCSPNRLDLNKSPSACCSPNVHDDFQEDFRGENELLRISNEQEGDGSKRRIRLSEEQYDYLQGCFKQNPKIDNIRKEALARHLNISPRKVQVWFQNRRARAKSKENEMNVWQRELKALRKENIKLQKELAEMKALKQAPETPFPAPPVIVCSSCQRVLSTHNTIQFTTCESNQQ